MPGSPPTSPNFGAPRTADGDVASFSSQLNAVIDAFDAKAANVNTGQGNLPGDIITSIAATRPGCLLCNGQAVNRADYPALNTIAATLGYAAPWGPGNGTTTFNVPNYIGEVLVGAGTRAGMTTRAVGASGGEETHQLTAAETPAVGVSFGGNVPLATDTWNETTFTGASSGSATPYHNSASGFGSSTGTTTSGGGGAHNNMQPYAAVNVFVKT